MAKTPRAFVRIPFVPYEEYATTFGDMQRDLDRAGWVGTGCTAEFPHNEGSLEKQVDEEQGRKIAGGDRY